MTTSSRIRSQGIDIARLVAGISHPGAGAVATFVGVVRDENEGRPVSLLEYEAYGTMAEAELGRILDEILREIPGARVDAAHRTGALAVGDVAVACVASAPHRDEALRAVRELIERIKARLPIWKREHGPDGPYWVGWRDARCADCTHDAHEHPHDRA